MQWVFKVGGQVVDSAGVSHTVTVRGPLPNGPVRTVSNTDPGSSSFRYDVTTKTWSFNLQTKEADGTSFAKGNYDVQITPTTPGFAASPVFQIKVK